jgi:hypothetical protein
VTHEAADSALYRQETPAADLWPPVQNEISSEQVPNRKEIHSSSKVSNDMRLRERKRKQVSGSTPTNLNRVVGIKKCHEGSEEVSMPMVALKDMERGRSTLEDYVRRVVTLFSFFCQFQYVLSSTHNGYMCGIVDGGC